MNVPVHLKEKESQVRTGFGQHGVKGSHRLVPDLAVDVLHSTSGSCEHGVSVIAPEEEIHRGIVNLTYSDSEQPATLELAFQGAVLVNVNIPPAWWLIFLDCKVILQYAGFSISFLYFVGMD